MIIFILILIIGIILVIKHSKTKQYDTYENQQELLCEHATEKNEDLEFYIKYNSELVKYEKRLVDYNVASSSDDIDLSIQACKNALNEYNAFQSFCDSKGAAGAKYFSKMWVHCHNSNDNDFSFDEPIKERLAYYTEHYDELKDIQNFSKDADKTLLDLISKNPGIVQSDLYNNFNESYKSVIRDKLYHLDKNGQIIREKCGRSYKLSITQ